MHMSNSPKTTPDNNHVKIEFHVENDNGGVDVESMWAIDQNNGHYILDNTPFYAYGISLGDTFIAEKTPGNELAVFKDVVQKSDNRTIRIIFTEEEVQSSTADSILAQLAERDCAYEGADASYYAITIPADADLFEIAEFLTHNEVMWEQSDPIDDES